MTATATAMDATQALSVLYYHVSRDAEPNLALLRQAAFDGEAETADGYLIVCNDANPADPRFSVRNPEGLWWARAGGWVLPEHSALRRQD
jgi:hypothetical protein